MIDLNYTNEELNALEFYINGKYEAINQMLVSDCESDIALLSDETENKSVEISYSRSSVIENLRNIKLIYKLILKACYKNPRRKITLYRGTNIAELERIRNEVYIDKFLIASDVKEKAEERYAANFNRPASINITLDDNIPYIYVDDIFKDGKEKNTVIILPFTRIRKITESLERQLGNNSKYLKTFDVELEKQELDSLTDQERNGLYAYILDNAYFINKKIEDCIKLEKENAINFESIRKLEQLLNKYETAIEEKENNPDYSDIERENDCQDVARVKRELEELKDTSTNLFERRKQNIEFVNLWKRNIAVYMIAECKEIEKLFEDLTLLAPIMEEKANTENKLGNVVIEKNDTKNSEDENLSNKYIEKVTTQDIIIEESQVNEELEDDIKVYNTNEKTIEKELSTNENIINIADAKSKLEVVEDIKSKLEVVEDIKSRLEVPEAGKSSLELPEVGKPRLEVVEDNKSRLEAVEAGKSRLEVEENSKSRLEVVENDKSRLEVEENSKQRLEVVENDKSRLEVEENSKQRLEVVENDKSRLEVEENSKPRLEVVEDIKSSLELPEVSKSRLEVVEDIKPRLEVAEVGKSRLEAVENNKSIFEVVESSKPRLEDNKTELEDFKGNFVIENEDLSSYKEDNIKLEIENNLKSIEESFKKEKALVALSTSSINFNNKDDIEETKIVHIVQKTEEIEDPLYKKVKEEAKENIEAAEKLLQDINSLITKQQNHAKIAGNMEASYSALNNAFDMRKVAENLLELLKNIDLKIKAICEQEKNNDIEKLLEKISKVNIEISTLINYLNNPKIALKNSKISRFDEIAIIEENELKRGIAEKIREIRGEAELKKLKDDLEIIEDKGTFSRIIGIITGRNKLDDLMVEQIVIRQKAIRRTLSKKLSLAHNYSIHELMAEIVMFINENEDDELVEKDVEELKKLAEELRRNYVVLESKVQSIIEQKEGSNLLLGDKKITRQEMLEIETYRFLNKYGYDLSNNDKEEPRYQDTMSNEIGRIIEYINSSRIL